MTTRTLLTSLLHYKANADAELIEALSALPQTPSLDSALRILNHIHLVDRIFVANLQNRPHNLAASWSDATPSLPELANAIRATDQWYLDHAEAFGDAELEESIGFVFTDGARGRMTRAEMLAHVITHAGYHRGEIGNLLPEIGAVGARDVFTGYLHRSDPSRRN